MKPLMRGPVSVGMGLLVAAAVATAAFAQAQPTLSQVPLTIDTKKGPVKFSVEVASDDASRERGLMFRTHMDKNAGMLFEFPGDQFESFWMKNTILPLDLLFIKRDGTISSISANAKPYSEATINSVEPVCAVLELNAGSAAALGIRPGQKAHAAFFGNLPTPK